MKTVRRIVAVLTGLGVIFLNIRFLYIFYAFVFCCEFIPCWLRDDEFIGEEFQLNTERHCYSPGQVIDTLERGTFWAGVFTLLLAVAGVAGVFILSRFDLMDIAGELLLNTPAHEFF